MGIGAALAMGLVQGFTKNIEKEQQNREADSKKLDDLNTLMFDAALKGTLHPTNATVISASIRDARGELDDKERISIFGKSTPRVGVDVSELAPFLHYSDPNKKDDDGITKTFGKGVDFTSPYWKTMNASTANDWLAEVAAKHTAYQSIYAEHPDVYQSVVQAVEGAKRTVMQKAIESAGGDKTKVQVPKFTFLDPFTNFGSDMNLQNLPASAENVTITNDELSKAFNTNVVTSFSFSEEASEEMHRVAGISTDSPEELNAMSQIAKGLGTSVAELGNTWKTYTARFGMTDDMSFQLLTASIQLGGKNPYINTLDPDEQYYTYSDTEKVSAYQTIASMSPDKAFNSLVFMLAPYMKYNKESGMILPGYDTLGSPTQKQDYVVKRLGGQFKNFGELDKMVTANETAVNQLETYIATLDMTNAPLAYQQTKLFLNGLFGFTSDRSFFGALKRDLFTGNTEEQKDARIKASGGREYYLDENNAYQSYLDEKVNTATDAGLSAELEAFRVGLAFQMARAADPSGRLSNQDIELQMVRLGGPFRTIDDAVAATGVVLDQFKEEVAKYKVFRDFGAGTGNMSDADAGVIDAAIVIKDMERTANRVGTIVQETQAAAATSFENRSQNPSANFTAADGSEVYMALDDSGASVRGMNGKVIYTDAEGSVVTDVIPKQAAPSGGGEEAQAVPEETKPEQPEGETVEEPAAPTGEAPTAGIPYTEAVGTDAKYSVSGTSPNIILTEKATGKALPGTYRFEGSMFVQNSI